MLTPDSPEVLAAMLAQTNADGKTIRLGGNFTKDRLGGSPQPADVTVSTRALNKILIFEPKDLTISVEAGLPYAELTRVLDEHRMMVPLDPPYAGSATVGGAVVANTSGPRRRLYGTARDLVIGMKFVTLEGRIVQSGGMVVKNVAGLDMSKLLIGSFGTLAAVTSLNFKLIPKPAGTRTFLLSESSLATLIARRDAILQSVLQPIAVDLLNPQAASRVRLEGWCLLVQCGGNEKVLVRYRQELDPAEPIDESIWERVREFSPAFLAEHPGGFVKTASHKLMELSEVVAGWPGPVVARAASGVAYLYGSGDTPDLWPNPGSDFAAMKRIKEMMDPKGLLNRGRLYGRI